MDIFLEYKAKTVPTQISSHSLYSVPKQVVMDVELTSGYKCGCFQHTQAYDYVIYEQEALSILQCENVPTLQILSVRDFTKVSSMLHLKQS